VNNLFDEDKDVTSVCLSDYRNVHRYKCMVRDCRTFYAKRLDGVELLHRLAVTDRQTDRRWGHAEMSCHTQARNDCLWAKAACVQRV